MLSADGRLVKRVLAGDPEAGVAFVERFRHDLFNLFVWLGHDHDLAQDLTQDTLLRCWQHLPQYRGDAALRTWVHAIGLSRFSAHYRAETRERRAVTEYGSAPSEPRDPHSAQVDLRLALADALSQLPDAERRAVVLCKLQGFTLREAGAVLEAPVGTVAWQVATALRKLRDLLSDLSAEPRKPRCMEVAHDVSDRPESVSSRG